MKQSAPIRCVVCAIALVAAAAEAKADDWFGGWAHAYPQQWELTLDFDGRRRTVENGTTTDMDFEEKLRFRQDGYVLDPGIGTFSLDATFAFEQGRSSGYNSSGDSSGTFADYNLRASALQGSTIPVNGYGGATRSSGTLDGSLGRRTEFLNETRDLTVNYRNAYFPSSLRYSERHLDEETTSGLSNTRTEQANTLRTLRYSGRSRKMEVSLEENRFNDRAATTDNDYSETTGKGTHKFRWGKGSNLNTNLLFLRRSGFRKRRLLDLSESAKLRHSSKLETSYRYHYSDLKTETNTVTNEGAVGVTHRLYKNLTTNLNFSGSSEDAELSETQKYDAKLDFDYQKRVIWNGRLTAALGAGYGITDRVSTEGTLQTIDETHTVGVSLVVTLVQRFIDSATIIVTNQAGTVTYTEGTDYNVVSIAENRTELEILAAGLINNGDTILIDYNYQTLPTAKFSSIPYLFRAGLDFGWISAQQSFSGTKESLISGPDDSSLNNDFLMETRAGLKWDSYPIDARFTATRRYRKLDTSSTKSITLNQSLSYTLSRKAVFSSGANQDFTTSSARDSQTFSADASLNWRPLRGLIVRPGLRAWKRRTESETGDTSETFMRGDVSVDWRVRQIVLRFLYSHDYRSGTLTNSTEDRIKFTISRRF